jgi:hypothetical protein
MDTLLNTLINLVKVLITTLGLLLAPLLHSSTLTMKSVETAFQNINPSYQTTTTESTQTLIPENRSSASEPQTSRHNKFGNQRGERIAETLQSLPNTQGISIQKSSPNVLVKTGDKAVSASKLQTASRIINTISLPTLNSVLGLSPASEINIVLFSSAKSYGNALARAGIDQSSIKTMTTDTGGVTVNTTIWIPLYNLADNSDLANVLSHELFHACAASQGYGAQLPIWINEGTAWRIGLLAQQKVDPEKTSAVMANYQQDVLKAAQNGTLLSLNASEKDILNTSYNVEYEDYMAVEKLTNSFGVAAYKTFIQNLTSQNVDTDFQNTFHTTMDDFSANFLKSL